MNSKINMFVHLYETPLTPFGIPTPIVPRGSGVAGLGGGGHKGKEQVCLKCISALF